MTALGLLLFALVFILITPGPRAYLGNVSVAFGATMTAWAPFSYLLLMGLVAALFAGVWIIQTWPKHVEPENPMAKYRREEPLEDE
jgi:hypothetical protein